MLIYLVLAASILI